MDVLTFETCRAVNSEIIKQATLSWSIFIQQQWCMSHWFASCQQTCMIITIAVCTVKTPNDGQRNCPKHVEFYLKNKFENLVHLVGFITRIYHDSRSRESQTCYILRV